MANRKPVSKRDHVQRAARQRAAEQDARQKAAHEQAEARQAVAGPEGASPEAIARLQRMVGNRAVQRLLAQRAPAVGLEGGEAPAQVQAEIEQARGGGRPLDAKINKQVGGALGTDFTKVRVHTDANADRLNQSLSARAFTTGADIFFSRGTYEPGTTSGKRLLAHELTHVVQQGGGRSGGVQAKLTVGAAGDHYEQEAEDTANKVMGALSGQTAGAQIQRAPKEEEEKLQRAPKEEEEKLRRAPKEEEDKLQRAPKEDEEKVRRVLDARPVKTAHALAGGPQRIQRLLSSYQLKAVAGQPHEDVKVFGKVVYSKSVAYKDVIGKLDAYQSLLQKYNGAMYQGADAKKVNDALDALRASCVAYVFDHDEDKVRTPHVQDLLDDVALEKAALKVVAVNPGRFGTKLLKNAVDEARAIPRANRITAIPAVENDVEETAKKVDILGMQIGNQVDYSVGGKSMQVRVIRKAEVDEEKPFNTGSITSGMKLLKIEGKWYLFKPASGESGMLLGTPLGIVPGAGIRKAGAVSEVAEMLGIGTPKTEVVEYNGKLGSLQTFMSGAKSLAKVTEENPELGKTIRESQVMKDLDIFDYIIAQIDRHMGNFMIVDSGSGPQVRLIDNDAALPPTTERFTPGGQSKLTNWRAEARLSHYQRKLPPTISREFYRRLKAMNDNPQATIAVLEKYLKDSEVKGYLFRLDEVIIAIETGQIQVVR